MMQNVVPLHEPIKLTFSWLILIDEIWDSKYSEAIEHVCWGDSLCAPISRELEGTIDGENTPLCTEPSPLSEHLLSHLCRALCKSLEKNGPRTDHVCNSVKKKMSLFALESGSSPKCLAEILLAFSKASPSSSLTSW